MEQTPLNVKKEFKPLNETISLLVQNLKDLDQLDKHTRDHKEFFYGDCKFCLDESECPVCEVTGNHDSNFCNLILLGFYESEMDSRLEEKNDCRNFT